MVRNKKGDRAERDLVNELADRAFAVMRAPASGGATDRELPDVFCGWNGEVSYAIELKTSSGKPIYLDEKNKNEVSNLEYFAHHFGAEPRIGVKFNVVHGDPAYGSETDPGFYFFHPDSVHRTEGGNYRVKKEDIHEAETINDL